MMRIIFEIILFQVVGSTSQDLTVCYSRKFEFPDNATTDVTCTQTQSGNVEIKLQNACDGLDYISQCQPLYISVKPTTTSTDTLQPANCIKGMQIVFTHLMFYIFHATELHM
jgi:hypothetical protein